MIAQISRPSTSYSAKSVVGQLLGKAWPDERSIPTELSFIGAFAMLLLGVTMADGQVTEEERQRFKEILNNVLPSETKARQLFQKMSGGLKGSRLHLFPEALDCMIQELGTSERLLLLVLGYELAMADGELAASEAGYLSGLAQRNGVDESLLQAFQNTWEQGELVSSTGSSTDVSQLRYELDPARFRELHPSFCRAAGRIIERLPKPVGNQIPASQKEFESATLAADDGLCQSLLKHQEAQEQLAQKCDALLDIVMQSKDEVSFATDLETELKKLSEKMRSQTFRVAIVGEFSQGKSTLLNALLGEEIQPTRMIPCSGAITVLRYGKQRRVIERYHDGTEQEIPFEDYQERASIPEAAALDSRTEALSPSDLKELVLEHPGLALCRHGVELVDSPGLNEHPDRTRLTYQLLENVDALVFLANASRPLTEGERGLLQDFRQRLNGGHEDQPAENLFVLVNFMDLVRRQRDQEQVRQLFENFLLGENALLSSPERLHFTSAQAALDAIVDEVSDDPHLQSLQAFSGTLGSFLTQERGALQTKYLTSQFHEHCETSLGGLEQFKAVLLASEETEAKKQAVLETIGEASGQFECAFLAISDQYKSQESVLRNKLEIRFEQITENLQGKKYDWSSHGKGDTKPVITDFSSRFSAVISESLEKEIEKFEKEDLNPFFSSLSNLLLTELEEVQAEILRLDPAFSESLVKQNEIIQSQLKKGTLGKAFTAEDGEELSGVLTGTGLALGVGVAVLTSVTFLPGLLLSGAIAKGLKFLMKPSDEEIIQKVVNAGLANFNEQAESTIGKIMDEVGKSFKSIKGGCHTAARSQIQSLNKLVEQIEESNNFSVEERAEELRSLESLVASVSSMNK